MYTYPWYHWITFFYIYCFCGWIFESGYVSIKSGHFVNRGFLRLPMLPLYGTGAVMMLWFSLPVKDSIVLVYFAGVIAATILEYVTGYVMERLFKMKYWDYSSQPFNLHGYICLGSSIAWGFLTIFLTNVIHQPIAAFVLSLNPAVEFTFIGVVSVFFLSDSIKSTKEALDLGRALETMTKMKAELEEVQVQLALLKAETSQRVMELREETAQRVSGMKEETALRVAEATQKFLDRGEREEALSARLHALTESYKTLSHHMSFYRKSILRGNPTSSSSKFAEALKEFKDSVGSFKQQHKNN